MVVVLIVSIMVGTFVAEVAIRTFGRSWLHEKLGETKSFLEAFKGATEDDARQALLMRMGCSTLKFSLAMLGVLLGLTAIVCLAPWALQWSDSQQMAYFVASSLIATCWWIVRGLKHSLGAGSMILPGHAYSTLERFLHWLALGPVVVRHLSFDLERYFALPKRSTKVVSSYSNQTEDPSYGAVYICGLARSGTTMLLHILDQIDTFRSLTYRDMPFVLAPNLWKQISRQFRQQSNSVERSHGDGIMVDFDSPEGFEEVFWRTFGTQSSETKRCLGFDEPSPNVLTTFADYRALIANPRTESLPANGNQRRYLSKNNNNLLRLKSLCADPSATVLLVYRNPVATARSLMRQHQRFCVAQTEDPFTRFYMGWLVHYEFGLDHRPFCFAIPEMDVSRTPNDPNYWLDYWNAVYRHVLSQQNLRLYLVNHDLLCAQPTRMLDEIFAILGIKESAVKLAQKINPAVQDPSCADSFCPELLSRAEATHNALLTSSKNVLMLNVS
jgi:hypothetical protein